MKKRLISLTTAVVSSLFTILPSTPMAAEETLGFSDFPNRYLFVVDAVEEEGNLSMVLHPMDGNREYGTMYLRDYQQYFEIVPEYGDLLYIDSYLTLESATPQYQPSASAEIVNHGTAEEYLEAQDFHVLSATASSPLVVPLTDYTLQSAASEETFTFTAAQTLTTDTTVTFLMYDDKPVFPLLETTTEPLPTSKFVVVGINDAGNYVIQEAKHSGLTLYMRQTELNMYTEEETTLSYGDVLLLEGYLSYTELIGTNTFGLFANYNEEPQQDGKIYRIGSVYDAAETKEFTFEQQNGFNLYTAYCTFECDECVNKHCHYYYDFLYDYDNTPEKDYYQPDGIDWSSLRAGDKVTFYTYEGVPMLPTAVAYAGDVNADNAVTIADVIFLNRQILGDVETTRSTFNQELADYDGNGIIDAADSLMILKRIVELI